MEGSRVADVRDALTRRLAAAGVPSPAVDAALLVRHVFGWSGSELVLGGAEVVSRADRRRLADLAARRVAREPLQLLLGTVGFRALDLLVRLGVFIPRPETEILAEAAIARAPTGGIVVEPCTGTGAVACSVAAEVDGARVTATDVSPVAVALARDNAARAGVTVDVREGDLLAPVAVALRGRADILVSNPPYLASAELAGMEPEVADWDPPQALVAGPTGHEVSDRLAAAAPTWLRPGGWLLLEVDPSRAADTAHRARAAGLVESVVLPDLAGRDRIVVARAP